MGILSTNKKIINLGQGYSAGNGISIDDYVISYTGNEGQLYSAGQNIDIYDDQGQLYISGKDWSADIANASSNAYEQATALIPPEFDPSYISGVVDSKLDSTAFSTVSGDYATTSYVDMSDNLTYSRATAWGNQNLAPLNSVADNSAKWNEIEVYEQNSATYLTAHQDISNKLDTTAFSTVSGNFLTAHQVIPSAKWEDASDVVQSNSAQWSENTGDEEVNNAVYNNSAKWNDISVYQSNSASYLTAHQDISNKLDTTAFSTVSGTFLTAHQDLSNYATTGDLNTTSGILSGAIDYLSGNAGKTYTGISPIVVNNDTNEISADSQDITFGEGLDFTNGVLTVTAGGGGTTYTGDAQGALDEVYANSGVWLTAHQDISNKLDTTAFSTVSGTFLTSHQPISANEWNSVYETVETNSGSWTGGGSVDMSAYVPYSANNLAFLGTKEIYKNSAVGYNTIAHGNANTASAMSIAQGFGNRAGWESLAQGGSCTASGSSLAQGEHCYASAHSFAQGFYCSAKNYSISNGNSNYANDFSQAFGNSNTITTSGMAIGTYNKTSSNVSFVIGNGTSNNARSDSFIIYHDGSVSAAGKISANGVELGAGGGGTSLTGDAQGAVDEVYSNSAHWNDNYSTVTTNSASWGGTPLPMSAGDGIDIQIENDTLVISATGGAGNPEVESYVQTNSASIDEVVSTYETNSGTYLTAHQPISATEWNSNYDTVTTNSGVWGGSALQISAGPGIKLDMVNNTLVASTDETVLWSGNAAIGTEMTLSESFQNFKDIRIKNGHNGYWTKPAWTLTGNQDGIFEYGYAGNLTTTTSNTFTYEHYSILYSGYDNKLKATSSIGFTITTAGTLSRTVNSNNYSTRTYEIVGINRINSI